MNRIVGYAIAVLLGGALFWMLDRINEPESGPLEVRNPNPVVPAPAGSLEVKNPPPGGEAPGTASEEGRAARPAVGPREPARLAPADLPPPRAHFSGESGGPPPARGASVPAGAPGSPSLEATLEENLRLARLAFETGDTERGARLLRGVFLRGRHQIGLDLAPAARKLLELETSPLRRQEYLEYLLGRGEGRAAIEAQLAFARALAASGDPRKVRRAWREYTVAYDLAPDADTRRLVLEELEPWIEKMVLSGRFSPLLESYTVKPGDTLSGIAARYQTTADAIRRLNRLESDVIQPRMRLRILAGKVEIFVKKREFRLWVKVGGNLLLERPVGLGRDNSTPTGRFVIEVRQKDPIWYRPGEPPIPPGDPRNILGTRWLGFKDTEEYTGYGIHGTDDPASIGTESSSGCVRLLRDDVELLYDFVPRGTPVTILD